MPKFGLRYFFGSFLLSLVAVFAVTKAYFVLSAEEKNNNEEFVDSLPVKNIELFAAKEENDPLYDKFVNINQHNELPESIENDSTGTENSDTTLYDGILYQAENNEAETTQAVSEADNIVLPQENIETAATEINQNDDEFVLPLTRLTSNEAEDNELQIADAAGAPSFEIPLVHNFKTENGTVTFSDSADDNQIAMASADVSIDNLGTAEVAAVTEPLLQNEQSAAESGFADGLSATQSENPNPWAVAEISGEQNNGKKSLDAYTVQHSDNIISPDQEVADNSSETYQMQDNMIVPMPESIKNERNLTPQFSTSEENLKLERELRAKHVLPDLPEGSYNDTDNADDDDEIEDFDDDDDIDDETSKSLSESITEWFSGSNKKSDKDNISAATKKKSAKKENAKKSESSIFNKLLGIGKNDDESITPSELKLSFQPNRAEISGQTLEWLHAFSDNSVKNDDVFIEIRIDRSASYALQEKRLKLLYKILASNGVDYHKINIIFTDREPNSFIIRNLRYASEDDKIKAIKRADNPWY